MKGLLKFIAALCITMLTMLVFRALFFTIYTVPNNSMAPLLKNGDRILVNKCSYGLRTGEDIRYGYSRWIKQNLCKGDITAFNYPIDISGSISDNPVYVARCSALPGDTVMVSHEFSLIVPGKNIPVSVTPKNAVLLCNMLRMHEHRNSYICNDKLYIDGREIHSITFDNDYYWMSAIGSYNVNGSGYFGLVPEDHIVGRVVMTVYSTDRTKPFYNCLRWDRFLKLL